MGFGKNTTGKRRHRLLTGLLCMGLLLSNLSVSVFAGTAAGAGELETDADAGTDVLLVDDNIINEENDPTKDTDTGEKSAPSENDGAAEEKTAEGSDAYEENHSVEGDHPETAEQPDNAETQSNETGEQQTRIEFKASKIYFFNADIDINIYNCTDSSRDFRILWQDVNGETQLMESSINGARSYERWYLSGLKAGTTYKVWCDAPDVEQSEFTFTTTSLSTVSADISVKPYVSGVDIRIESNLPIPEARWDWPVCYIREKGETEWKEYGNNAAKQLDEHTLVYPYYSLYTETEYEYMVKWYYAPEDKTKSLLFVKDQIIDGYNYFLDENYNDYTYETFTTRHVKDAVALVTDMKLTNGGIGNITYTVTVSDLDETVSWDVTYNEYPKRSSLRTVADRDAEWTKLEGGGYRLTFKLDRDVEANKTYDYDFSVTANNNTDYMVYMDYGTFNTSGGGSDAGSGSATVLTRDMFTVNWADANITGGSNGTYGGSTVYTGKAIKPKVTKNTNVKGLTYKVSYQDNKNAGTARIVITGTKKCTGTIMYLFTISPHEITETQAAKVKVSPKIYSGNPNSPKFAVKYNGKTLKLDTDYRITNLTGDKDDRLTRHEYNSKNLKTAVYPAQKYTYTIEGINNYSGKLYEGEFTVKPCKLSKVKILVSREDLVTVKIGKSVVSASHYDIIEKELISTKGKAKKYRITIDLSKNPNVATTDQNHTVTKICTAK